MDIFKKKKILVTHNGTFHADDIFACATLSLYFKKNNQPFKIIRTRNQKIINSADFVVDVGGIYDPQINRYDHHQKEGSGARPNGIPYASFGLVWKHFGLALADNDSTVFESIDRGIACAIDAIDNGMDVMTPKFDSVFPYGGGRAFLVYAPTWKEDANNVDTIFVQQVQKAAELLAREIKVANDDSIGRKIIIDAYTASPDKRIVELANDFPRYLYQDTLAGVPEPLYVVYPSNHSDSWKVEAIHKKDSMESRKPFPENWRGFLNCDPKLHEITGLSDIVFSHKGGFLITTKSKASAVSLAEKALLA